MISKIQRNKLVQNIVDRWKDDEAKYIRLMELVADFFEKEISSTELLPSITYRPKSLISMIKTAIKKEKSYDEMHDKIGFRIVCHFKSELPVIKNFLESSFQVKHFESKSEQIKFDALGYASDHYDVCITPEITFFKSHKDLENIVFEIQVRTNCQHAWADVEHSLAYKQESDLPDNVKRRIFRLTSLLEICDDEFDSVNQYLLGLPESHSYVILHLVEAKFYKYAKRSFDKELSISTISWLSEKLLATENYIPFIHNLRIFLEQNENRIEYILSERKELLEKDYFLSQPEVMFIWYLIEKRQHDLISVWKEQFDIEDLKDLSVIWGEPITLPE